jgi:CubicO group peptidase (beta-lactamase class C family)
LANSDQITVRMLLNHTGGMRDFLDLAGPEIVANLEKVWEEEEFLEFASAQEPWFAPGEAQAYSNTDYTLLGMIIEEATGGSWREEMRQRIFEPLNLENTLLPELNDVTIPGDHAHGYADFGAGLVDATELANPSVVGAAGGQSLVTNAEDLSRFVTAVAAGELFQETGTMEEMLTFVPWPDGNLLSPYVNGYGLGVLQSAFGGGIEGVGHSGNTQGGYNSFVFYLPDQDMTISGAVNTDDFEAGYLLVPRALEVLVPGYSAPESEAEQPTPAGNVYEDPEGRFRVPLIGDWTQLETDGTYATFALADPPLELHFITADTDDLQVGVDTVIQGIGTDPTALTPTLAGETLGSWNVFQYSMAGGQGVTVLVQVKDATTYAIIGTGSEDVVNRAEPPADVMNTIAGFTFVGEEVDLPTTVEEFEAYVNSFVGDVPPGMSIAIALGDDVIYTKGFGVADGPQEKEATPDTVYQWGSMVKMVTASAIMQLWEQGLIDLDAPVSDYLDYVPAEYPITVRQLLNHSAGLPEADLAHRMWVPDGEPLVDPDLASRAYIEEIEGPIFEPGSASAYANPHLMLVGQIVAEVSGQPYIEYVQEHILAPLGMDNTDFSYSNEDILANAATHAIPVAQVEGFITSINEVWELGDASDLIRETDDQYAWLNHYNILAAYGGLKGPPSEAIRFMQMHLNGGELDGVRILSPESVALMQEIQLSTAGEPLLFTLGWFIHDDPEHPYIEHAGGGVGIRDLMRLYPDDGIAIVLMSNAGGYDELPVMDAAANVVFSMMGGAPADEGEAQSESLAEQQDLTPELLADFEAYVEQNRESLNVPGAVVAIVQGGEIVYAEGFGVKELGGDDPVTADTVFSIGSTTKALTSMMAASLVDDGLIEWDTPLVEVMPQFQLSDEGATQQITLREAFAHTSGLPNTDLVLFFSGQPEDYVEYLAGVPLAAAPGEAYGYQNQMYALGGYAAAMAAGAEYGENLFPTYAGLMQERVFDPLGMTSATFSAQEAAAGPNHATPHFMSLNGTLAETGFDVTPTKYWDVDAIAPSGTARMSAPDLGRFLITMLSGGVAPDGSRAISAENLAETWTEQIALEPNPYLEQRGSALGWSTVTYQGIPLVSKDGSSSGFFTQMAFIPEADTGIVVLTNADVLGGSLVRNVQYRFIEMLFGLEPLIDEVAAAELEGIGGASDLFNQLVAVDPETVAPFLGSYDMEGSPYTVELRDGRLWVSFGEVDFIELLAAPDGSYMAISGGSDFLLAPFQFVEGDDGRITMVMFGQLELPKLD